jgi:ribosomal-protein-serine acetyltransferase
MVTLRRDGIELRSPSASDADALASAVGSSLESLAPWMPWATPTYDAVAARTWIDDDTDEHRFVIIDHDGELVGTCGLNAIDHANRRANLGYWVRVDRQRRGIATTATLLLRDHALHTLGLQRVEVLMSTRNHASRRVAERAGATDEGVLRARLHLHGHAHDAHSYSFTTREAARADIAAFAGDRVTLRHLFELADDSALEIDRTLQLGQVLTARQGDTTVGIVHLVPTDRADTLEIRVIAVAEAHQNHGIGRALLDAAIAAARTSDHDHLALATATADANLLRFYQRHGFRLTHIEPDAFTPDAGYPAGITIHGIPLRDRAWLRLDL